MYHVPKGVLGRVLLSHGSDECYWRRDGWFLPYRIVLQRRWCNLNDTCVHAVPRGDIRLCYNADDRSVLGQLRRGVLLPIGRDCSNWRRRLPNRIVLHVRWCYINDSHLHAVPCGDLRLC